MCACVVLLVHMAYTASIHPSSCCACVVVIAHVSQVSANGDLHQDDDPEGSKARRRHSQAWRSYLLPDECNALR